MDTLALLEDLRRQGVELESEGQKLLVRRTPVLTSNQRLVIRKHKAKLLLALNRERQQKGCVDAIIASPLEPYMNLVDAALGGELPSGPVCIALDLTVGDLQEFVLRNAAEIERFAPTKTEGDKLKGWRRRCLITLMSDLAKVDCWLASLKQIAAEIPNKKLLTAIATGTCYPADLYDVNAARDYAWTEPDEGVRQNLLDYAERAERLDSSSTMISAEEVSDMAEIQK